MAHNNWDEIFKFNNDSNVNQLRNLYSTPSWFEILGVDRIEALHSNYIAWFLGNKNLGLNPSDNAMTRFIDVVIKKSKEQQAKEIDSDFINSVASRGIVIKDIDVDKEVSYKDSKKNNRIDLIATCEVCINNEDKELVLYIENKVGANETYNKSSDQLQTQVYYDQYHEVDDADRIQLFVFLSPYDNAKCDCNEFIKVTYNDLLMYVLEPIAKIPTISKHDRFFIKEYIRTLGAQVMNHQDMGFVMAITDEEKHAYSEIYNSYHPLFLSALAAKISKRYISSSQATKKGWKEKLEKWGLAFVDVPDEQLVAFWDNNSALIKNTIDIAAPQNKGDLLDAINVILKDRTNYTIKYLDKTTLVNKSHLASRIVEAYIKLNELNENDYENLKRFFNNIREPFILDKKPAQSNARALYDPVKLGTKQIWIPNHCWPAGSRPFERLLKVAGKIEGLTIE